SMPLGERPGIRRGKSSCVLSGLSLRFVCEPDNPYPPHRKGNPSPPTTRRALLNARWGKAKTRGNKLNDRRDASEHAAQKVAPRGGCSGRFCCANSASRAIPESTDERPNFCAPS